MDKLIYDYVKNRQSLPMQCAGEASMATTESGHFYLTKEAKRKQITCSVTPINRKDGDFKIMFGRKRQVNIRYIVLLEDIIYIYIYI